MISGLYDKNLLLVEKFGREKVNLRSEDGIDFRKYILKKFDEDFWEIIKFWFAAQITAIDVKLIKNKKYLRRIKDWSVFFFRTLKKNGRKKEMRRDFVSGSIVFFPISESTVFLFEPIMRELKKEGLNFEVLRYDYSLNGLKRELDSKGIKYLNFEHFIDREVIDKSISSFKKVREIHKVANHLVCRKKEYLKTKSAVDYYFGSRKRFVEIVEFFYGFKNFLLKTKPSVVVLPDETIDIGRVVSYLCNKFKIPCLVMQHGSITEEGAESGESYASKKAVFGSFARDILIKKGFDKNKIEITGSPVYDSFCNKKVSVEEVKKLKDKWNIRNNKVVVFASTGSIERAKKRLEMLFGMASKIKDVKIVIKEHPAEYYKPQFEDFYYGLAKKFGLKIIVSKDDMHKVLSIADVFITDFSTTIIEAVILKKPVILTNFEKDFAYESFPEMKGVIEHVDNFEDFSDSLKNSLKSSVGVKQDKFRNKIIEKNIYKNDGKSSQRLVKLIMEVKNNYGRDI